MVFKTKWEDKADVDLESIDSDIALKIYNRVKKYLISAPKELGKALVGKYKGHRYGDYRVLYEIDSQNNLVIINRIGH